MKLTFDVDIVRQALPETWTNVQNLNWLQIGFALKLAGMNWKSLESAMATLERAGIVQRDGYCIRRSP